MLKKVDSIVWLLKDSWSNVETVLKSYEKKWKLGHTDDILDQNTIYTVQIEQNVFVLPWGW
jgi:hypothetical protein